MKKIFLIIGGSVSLALGVIGIFLPVLPTTCFLLLAAGCYVKSSERLYNWLINHKILGLYIRSYLEYHAISMKTKVISIAVLWVTILSSAIFFISLLWLQLLLVAIAVGVTIHLAMLKTLTPAMMEEAAASN